MESAIHYSGTPAGQYHSSTRSSYLCPTCEKSFKRPSTLNEHIRATHTTDRIICSTCNKAFKRINDLKRHEKLHSGEKSFTCNAMNAGGEVGCGKKFARLHSLREHQRRRIGSTCWDAFVEAQTQLQSRPSSPRSIPAFDDRLLPTSNYEYTVAIRPSIEVDTTPQQPERPMYKPIDWLNWSMQSTTGISQPRPSGGNVCIPRSQGINPADISWHSVLESRLRHDAESIIASSRNSSFSSNSSYPITSSTT